MRENAERIEREERQRAFDALSPSEKEKQIIADRVVKSSVLLRKHPNCDGVAQHCFLNHDMGPFEAGSAFNFVAFDFEASIVVVRRGYRDSPIDPDPHGLNRFERSYWAFQFDPLTGKTGEPSNVLDCMRCRWLECTLIDFTYVEKDNVHVCLECYKSRPDSCRRESPMFDTNAERAYFGEVLNQRPPPATRFNFPLRDFVIEVHGLIPM